MIGLATVDISLAKRVLKALAICEVIASPALTPTRTLLRQALNLPASADSALTQALDILEQRDAIIVPSDDEGAYNLPITGRANSTGLRRRITDKARELQTSIASLQARRPPEPIKADAYNRKRGTHRAVTAFYVGLDDLLNPVRLKNDLGRATDGLLWYVIASSESERTEALSRARELVRDNQQLMVAVPIRPLPLLNAFRNYEALEAIRADPSLNDNERQLLSDAGQLGKGYAVPLQNSILALKNGKQWEWVYGVSSPGQITPSDLVSRMMDKVFVGTPEHQLAQHFKPDSISPSLKKAAGELLKGEVRLTKGKAPSDESVLRSGAVPLGLLAYERLDGAFEVFSIAEPNGNVNSKRVWQFFYERLSTGKTWSGAIATLRQPPYGMYDSLLLIFVAAFFVHYADAIEITKGAGAAQRSQSLDLDVLKDMVEKPQDYTVRLHQLTDQERQWLRRIVTDGLHKSFDSTGGRGTTLRARVAEQVRLWHKRLQLPLLAERLTVEQLTQFDPDRSPGTLASVPTLLQAARADIDLGSALLKNVPEALGAPANHAAWTDATIDTLVSAFIEACGIVERLPKVLKGHAVGRVAAVFGYEDRPNPWEGIYQWRIDRKVVDPALLKGPTRTLFYLANDSTGSVATSFLDEFARQLTGLHSTYQQWPMLDQLDRLVQRIQEAKTEVDDSWKARAPVEDIWRDGIARAALGRPVSGATTEQVAQVLAEWSKGIEWPASVHAIDRAELQQVYPELTIEQCADISTILQRVAYSASDWQGAIIETLAPVFGIKSWSSGEVEQGVKRFTTAIQHAQSINDALRRHTLARLLAVFTNTEASAAPSEAPEQVIQQWRGAHAIPEANDLSDSARLLLQQIDSTPAPETLLLTTLPRALPDIAQTSKQWPTYATLNAYVEAVARAVREINNYVPLTAAEYAWLSGIVIKGLRQPLTSPTQEQRKLARSVLQTLNDWLVGLRLPSFSTTLTVVDLHEIDPQADAPCTASMVLLLKMRSNAADDSAALLLSILPTTLGIGTPHTEWDDDDVAELLERFNVVCRQIEQLNSLLKQHLYDDIGTAFGIETNGDGVNELLAGIRIWRRQHVIFPNEKLSSAATAIYEALQSPDDPEAVLLERLPRKLAEVRAPYMQWPTWSKREQYLDTLHTAAKEITKVGQVGEATPAARTTWAEFKQRIEELPRDDQRWLIQTFNEAFRV